MATPDPTSAPAQPADPIDLTKSVAGEEDPGASIDLADSPKFPLERPAEGAALPDAEPRKDRKGA